MKRGTPDHPKVLELAEALGCRRPAAIGHLELLFHFTAQYAPRGDIGRYSNKRIAAALDWPGNPDKLITALVTTGWLDSNSSTRLLVHDWHEHADRTVRQRLSRSGVEPIKPTHGVTENLCTQSEPNICTPPEPEPMPEPVPAMEHALTHTAVDVSDLAAWIWDKWPAGRRPPTPDEVGRILAPVVTSATNPTRCRDAIWANARAYLQTPDVQRGVCFNFGKWIRQGHWQTSAKQLQVVNGPTLPTRPVL